MNTTGLLLDPKRFAVHDGPGIRTTFFLKGCPLHCIWCHNPESISAVPQLACYAHKCLHCGECAPLCPQHAHTIRSGKHEFSPALCKACGSCEPECPGGALKLYGRRTTVKEALRLALEDRSFYGESGGGVTLSGGEPLVQPEFTQAFLSALKENGIHTALDTCCFVPREALRAVLPVTDLFLVEFKHADSANSPDSRTGRSWTICVFFRKAGRRSRYAYRSFPAATIPTPTWRPPDGFSDPCAE